MRITADTNVLLRLILADDETQSLIAVETMERASLVAVSVRWSRLPGQVCGKVKLKPMLSCRAFGHQVMGGMPPMT